MIIMDTERHLISNLSTSTQTLLEHLPIGMAIVTLESTPRVILFNAQAQRSFGYSLADIPTVAHWSQLAYPDENYRREIFTSWDAAVERAVTETGSVESMEACVTSKDGRTVPTLFNAIVLEDRLVVAMVDISALRQAEHELRSARAALERTAFEVTENIPVGTYTMVLPPGAALAHFSFMSERFLALCGLDRETAAADPLKAFACVHPDDYERWVQTNAEAFANKQPFTGETRVIVDGQERWIRAESRPRERADGSTVWEGVLIDITERKQYEAQLTQAQADAEAANQAKSAFLANMSHEIRTPMTSIIGLAQLLLRAELERAQRDLVEKIERSAQSLLGILNDILDVSKIEAGKLTVDQTPFDARQIVSEVLQLLVLSTEEKQIKLHVDIDPALAPRYLGDPLRLKQVLTNLLGNAIKFTHQGSVHLSLRPGTHGQLCFAIRDTGIGISVEQRQRLFEPFAQADTSRTRQYGGTGLGLAVSKQLIELMGGQISLESTPGQGSCFRFEIAAEALPAADPTAETAPGFASEAGSEPPDSASAQPPSALVGHRLLLAEDTPINQQIVCGLLADTGLLIEVVDNGQQALERFQAMARSPSQRPDLILMDIQMPVLDGYEAARQIRALDAEIPIIALTAHAYPDDIEKARAAGMNAHLSKPIDIRQLKALLGRFLLQEPRHEVAIADLGSNAQVESNLRSAQSRQAAASATEPSTTAFADADQRSSTFPDIPGIDRERACLMMDQDPARFLGFLNRFCEDFADAAAQIRQALTAGDPNAAAQQLHQLHGIAGQLGARALAQSAAELEHSIHHSEQVLDALLANFATQLQNLISASAPWRQRLPATPFTAGASTSDANSHQLLIVDDSPLAIEFLCSVLADMGKISIATSGDQALVKAAQTRFDLVLLDARMPGLDGFETCTLLHRDHPEIPIIFVTAEQDSDSEVRALQAGALDFISKPYNPPVVRARVGVYLTLKAQTDRLRESEARYARAVRGTSDGLWEWLIPTGEAYISPRYKELLGYTEAEIDDSLESFQALLHPEDRHRVDRAHQAHLERRVPFDIEFRLRTKAGHYRWFRSRAQAEWDRNGCPIRMAGAVSDITERKRAEVDLLRAKEEAEQANRALQAANTALNQLATTDRLTGVANRRFFETEAETAIRQAERFGTPLSLLLFDIDHFKMINDRHGHLIGDQVLIEVTRRAQSRLREIDILARWGGEEFVVLLQHTHREDAAKLAERLRTHLAETPVPKVGQVTASFGVAEWRPSDNLDQWIKCADDSLYTAKRQGRNQVAVYSDQP
ncbi:MAG: hypothetical protein C1943_12090 [Halochromatium sp.]|nr:hypothetical protein [Halochromatium sp.]